LYRLIRGTLEHLAHGSNLHLKNPLVFTRSIALLGTTGPIVAIRCTIATIHLHPQGRAKTGGADEGA
jgi:hypothetical protein